MGLKMRPEIGVPIGAASTVKQMNRCGDKGAKLQGNAVNLPIYRSKFRPSFMAMSFK